ncbi:Gfo/Idh/MocA family protein [Paraburkholderia domus]|uniref:Gfo/Idh/MocA family protein n=1 Tax=Paraburkholderia domus TaxID=2793075 RepID=UPI0019122724|nr:Gfo/Idh/MocA family oxidoreductase [Paraburkholderia domus]MBK5065967.1 Gfo/Idh/MocA family oxidoreductase [Burkholderia sp. R-70199]CAE6965379.1 Myo-inositol 2-dehydrogenase [Paraburkholderia domus]
MRKSRVAIIGAGLAATPHALALNELRDEAEVIGVVGRSRERLEQFTDTYGFPVAESFDAVLKDPRVDAVLVLTPPHTHLEFVEQAAAEGKHVLLEKPLDVSLARAERTVVACREAGVQLGVVFQNRFRPAVQRLAALAKSGALGALAYAGVSLRWWRPQSYYDESGRGTYARDGGGVLMTQAIHSLDILTWLAGEVSSVVAATGTTSLHSMEAEDFASAALTFESGAVGHMLATTAAYPGFPERIELVGTNGTAVLEGGHLRVFFHDGRVDGFHDPSSSGFGAKPMDFSHTAHRDLLRDFFAAMREERAPLVTGDDALRVQRLIERITNSGGHCQ